MSISPASSNSTQDGLNNIENSLQSGSEYVFHDTDQDGIKEHHQHNTYCKDGYCSQNQEEHERLAVGDFLDHGHQPVQVEVIMPAAPVVIPIPIIIATIIWVVVWIRTIKTMLIVAMIVIMMTVMGIVTVGIVLPAMRMIGKGEKVVGHELLL